MFTSKPPFQSSTTDEIYRRARERDYEWPADTPNRTISRAAKELVANMLTDADVRPEPDAIVEHEFFTNGYMPSESEMSHHHREVPPQTDQFYGTWDYATQAQSLRNLKTMCRECCIGPWSSTQVIHTQIWKEMAAEEKAGLTPLIPLAENIVYRPFDDWIKEQQALRLKYSASVSSLSSSTSEPPIQSTVKAPSSLLRQPPQSFAAQQRAQSRPATLTAPPQQPSIPESLSTGSQTVRARSRPEPVPELQTKEEPKSLRGSVRTVLPATRSAPNVQVVERAAALSSSASVGHLKKDSGSIRTATLFSPVEKPIQVNGTGPDAILERLRRLQGELERALNSRTMAIISSKTVTPPHPHVVVKWVDYTNKFGLGYILNDGSVGCILRDIPTTEGSKTALLPPAGVFIRGAERHILRRQDENYNDRNQPVPMSEPIKFFENNGESGLSQVLLSPEQFRVTTNPDGTAGKMNPGKDIYQHRKRERIILWKKFANYMIAYGRDEISAEEAESAETKSPGAKGTSAELVTFYQRFGDVGCWAFCDGHLQVSKTLDTKLTRRLMLIL
jgi:hypothetical protein